MGGSPRSSPASAGHAAFVGLALLVVLDTVYGRRARVEVVFGFTFEDGRIVAIDLIADPERIRELDVAPL